MAGSSPAMTLGRKRPIFIATCYSDAHHRHRSLKAAFSAASLSASRTCCAVPRSLINCAPSLKRFGERTSAREILSSPHERSDMRGHY